MICFVWLGCVCVCVAWRGVAWRGVAWRGVCVNYVGVSPTPLCCTASARVSACIVIACVSPSASRCGGLVLVLVWCWCASTGCCRRTRGVRKLLRVDGSPHERTAAVFPGQVRRGKGCGDQRDLMVDFFITRKKNHDNDRLGGGGGGSATKHTRKT